MKTLPTHSPRSSMLPDDFSAWSGGLADRGAPPVIGIAGSRGKSSVVHLLDAIVGFAGARTAHWTDSGVTIGGRKQRGELLPWTRALGLLGAGELDVAIQELDWDMVHAVGLPRGAYPVLAVINLCVNNDACLLQDETLRALRALRTIREAAHPDALFVLNADDWAVAGGELEGEGNQILVAQSRDTPLMRDHLARGGAAAWVENGDIRFGTEHAADALLPLAEIPITHDGAVGFLTTNVLTAVAVARGIGISASTVANALRLYHPDPLALPGSFTTIDIGGALVIVDRPAPPWFLRAPLRAVARLTATRHVRIIGRASAIPDDELHETGRMLGRGGGLCVLHSEDDAPERTQLLRSGIAANEVPPIVIHVESEAAAIDSVLRALRPDDVVYMLADDPKTAVRRLQRAAERKAEADLDARLTAGT
ncbi:MAG: hypothetical protein IT337_00255 [Thermomicrobiales bacterium]|nr:hypothetical protein [Thermomicrobiales bacterium]